MEEPHEAEPAKGAGQAENTADGADGVDGAEHQPTGEGGSHVMSIGYFVGGIVALFGVILVVYGLVGPAEQSDKAGFNINLVWGLLMLIGGIAGVGWNRLRDGQRSS